jgi:uncharacterized membrane protein HdeD (DUF308 family)
LEASPALLAREDLMFLPENMRDEMRTRQRAAAFLCNATAALSLLALGFPLTPATIRSTLLGWVLVVVAITRFMLALLDSAEPCTQELCHKEKNRD